MYKVTTTIIKCQHIRKGKDTIYYFSVLQFLCINQTNRFTVL